MIAEHSLLRCEGLFGRIQVAAAEVLVLDALYLGAPGRPAWQTIKDIGPIRFNAQTGTDEARLSATAAAFHRDFGDSMVACGSDQAATTHILPGHQACNPRHIPAALSFAFAQQWARLGHACVHGALLNVEGTGVLVLGLRGAGKSVLSTSALVAGGAIVSDDYLLAGEQAGTPVGERIRGFLSLRASWAASTLFNASTQPWQTGRSGNRAFLAIAADDPRFPSHCRIDRIWVLQRPSSGRRHDSVLTSISQAELYTALIAATQPLLLGSDFPHERAKLGALIGKLATETPAARVETGQDIVLAPKKTWHHLLGSTPPAP